MTKSDGFCCDFAVKIFGMVAGSVGYAQILFHTSPHITTHHHTSPLFSHWSLQRVFVLCVQFATAGFCVVPVYSVSTTPVAPGMGGVLHFHIMCCLFFIFSMCICICMCTCVGNGYHSLQVYMCICVYVCMCTCVYIYVYGYTGIRVYVCICVRACFVMNSSMP
jgi:hypothetical protein